MINVNDVQYTQQTPQSESIISKVNNNNRLSSSSSSSSGLKKNEAQQQKQQQQRRTNEGISAVIRNKILANNWKQIFAGIVVVDIVYTDNNLVIFDIDLLARLKGIRLCIRKEPDYF
jgi:beta-lactamase regulating signal transducer with metallopeptidase domain